VDEDSVERKEKVMKLFHRILIATDFTPASEPALNEAIEMAKGNGTELLIAHAYHPPDLVLAQSVAADVYQEWDQNLRTEVQERLQPLLGKARREGVKARGLVLSGAPFEAIAEAAKENDADLIIMGTHGRKGVSRFFVGSVASRVISTAPCPVMTVRAAES
jgi:nucleotide-binding universal stress UspA family protein